MAVVPVRGGLVPLAGTRQLGEEVAAALAEAAARPTRGRWYWRSVPSQCGVGRAIAFPATTVAKTAKTKTNSINRWTPRAKIGQPSGRDTHRECPAGRDREIP